ncbi:glycosyltransferase family 39 protein [Tautonia sociabilis]|uniref:glycosyltransferase family 39 protein n=1 Tax=Tautonia sociabilis TaxID=2080755 RepID=UPI0013155AA4|nr:glycosyltransferase family 39 protein [Tautonia sociabilis]
MTRREHWLLIGLVALTVAIHVAGMARTPLPSQDGLKFIRIAREFGDQPWADVVRRADQHPLYPALIAGLHPIVSSAIGEGPASWRVAAQGVSTLAMTAIVVPFFAFARELVGRRAGVLATLTFIALPISGRIGHETLSDATALLCAVGSLAMGLRAMRTGEVGAAIGAGAIGGIGFLARPEVALVPGVMAVGMGIWRKGRSAALFRSVAVLAPLLVCVGSYAAIKGTISEKLSMRYATGLGQGTGLARSVPHWLPRGLDDPRWDFSPKEESDAPGRLGLMPAVVLVAEGVGEASGWVVVPLALVGAMRGRGSARARRMVEMLAIAFAAVLVRHAMSAGYVSDRHGALLVALATPLSAAGALRIAGRFRPEPSRRRRLVIASLAVLAAVGIGVQLKPGHPSRWGHQQAGRWLADHARPGDAVLDTRGWAAFVSGLTAYDPWHIRQALTDARLSYVVVGVDELSAPSRRAETLGALLRFAAEPVAAFPSREGDEEIGVRVYRFRRPDSWEGIVR